MFEFLLLSPNHRSLFACQNAFPFFESTFGKLLDMNEKSEICKHGKSNSVGTKKNKQVYDVRLNVEFV